MASAVCSTPLTSRARHLERMGAHRRGARQALAQPLRLVVVHQEADAAAMHAVDRHVEREEAVQRLQHEAVAAERDDDVGILGARIAVKRA